MTSQTTQHKLKLVKNAHLVIEGDITKVVHCGNVIFTYNITTKKATSVLKYSRTSDKQIRFAEVFFNPVSVSESWYYEDIPFSFIRTKERKKVMSKIQKDITRYNDKIKSKTFYYVLNVMVDAKDHDTAEKLIDKIKCPKGVDISDTNESEENYDGEELNE